MHYLFALLFLSLVTGFILGDNKGLYVIFMPLTIIPFFYFSKIGAKRKENAEQQKETMSFWQTPVPYLLAVFLIFVISNIVSNLF
ncbi:hypothetical protein PN836_010620 [Ningiella sp. W23]|uniref:hypothetical protein n=1 Tax=Ningiella sp. W23 TaxID=3023715 RepID=UPI0037580ABC